MFSLTSQPSLNATKKKYLQVDILIPAIHIPNDFLGKVLMLSLKFHVYNLNLKQSII